MPLSDKETHLSSDEHRSRNIRNWCEGCNKYMTDTITHYRSMAHIQRSLIKESIINKQRNQNIIKSGLVHNENTHIMYNIDSDGFINQNSEELMRNILSKKMFPRFIFQVIYLAKFSKYGNG